MINFNLKYQNIQKKITNYETKIITAYNKKIALLNNQNYDKEKIIILTEQIERLEQNLEKYEKKKSSIIDKKIRLLEAIKKNDFEIIKAPRNWYTNYNNPYHDIILKCLLCGEEKKATKNMFKTKIFKCQKCADFNMAQSERLKRKQKYKEYIEIALDAYQKAKLRKPVRGYYYEDIHFTCEHGTDFVICISKLNPKNPEWCNCDKCIEERGGKKEQNRIQLNTNNKEYAAVKNYMYACISKLFYNSRASGLKLLSTKWSGENEYYDFECLICGKKIKYKGVVFTQIFSSKSKYTKVKEKGGCCEECFEQYKETYNLYYQASYYNKIMKMIKESSKDNRNLIEGI